MKKLIFSLIAVASILFAASVNGQGTPTFASQTLYSTNSATALVGSAILSPYSVLDCRKQAGVALQIDAMPKTTATDAVGIYMVPSVDGLTYATNQGIMFLYGPSGTAGLNKCMVTNLPSLGAGYWSISYITNAGAAASVVTNLVIKYGVKISAP